MSSPARNGKGRFTPSSLDAPEAVLTAEVVEVPPDTFEVDMLTEARKGYYASQRMRAAAEAEVVALTQEDEQLAVELDAEYQAYTEKANRLSYVRDQLFKQQAQARNLQDAMDAFEDVIKIHEGEK